MGRGNESLFKWSRSHDQNGCHAHMVKTLKNIHLRNQKASDLESWYAALGPSMSTTKFVQMMTQG